MAVRSGSPVPHDNHLQAAAVTRPVSLTPREQNIVQAVALGDSTRDVADRLRLSPYTIQGHLQRIYIKLGLQNRAALVRWAYETGLVSVQPGASVVTRRTGAK